MSPRHPWAAANAARNGAAMTSMTTGTMGTLTATTAMGTTPSSDSLEPSLCGGQPWQSMPLHCQKLPEMFDDFLARGRTSAAVITAVMRRVAMACVASYKPVSQMLPTVKDYGT